MTALQRLQEKIEQLKNNYNSLQLEIGELRSQLDGLHDNQGEQQYTIDQLRQELEDRDREIEAIIVKVEELLS